MSRDAYKVLYSVCILLIFICTYKIFQTFILHMYYVFCIKKLQRLLKIIWT